MSDKCPVCEYENNEGATKCVNCGFSDKYGINRNGQFINKEDLEYWLETKVNTYRVQWEAQKREAELLAQLEDARKKEEELKKTKKRETELLAQLEDARKKEEELKIAKKREKELLAQLEEAQKKGQVLIQQPPHKVEESRIKEIETKVRIKVQNEAKKAEREKKERIKEILGNIFGRVLALLFGLFMLCVGIICIWFFLHCIKNPNTKDRWVGFTVGPIGGIATIIYGGWIIITGVIKGDWEKAISID